MMQFRMDQLVFCVGAMICAIPAFVSAAGSECSTQLHSPDPSLLGSYVQKNGNTPDIYSVAGIGNHAYFFDPDFQLISPHGLAEMISKDSQSKSAKMILLAWPYSAWGTYSYAARLQSELHKPVVGFEGPLWWYPDGTAISSTATRTDLGGPDARNVAECISSDGRYHHADECKTLLALHDNKKAIFSNARFVLNCDQWQDVAHRADQGDPNANMQLYLFNFFVNIDGGKAAQYLAKAALGRLPLAEYLTAESMLSQTPPKRDLYIQFLQRAAADGSREAQRELAVTVQ